MFTFEFYIIAIILCVFFAKITKDEKWLRYVCIVGVSMFISYLSYRYIIALDCDFLYRYLIWMANDIINLAVLYWFWSNSKIYHYQFFTISFILVGMLFLNMFRFIDVHILNVASGDAFYINGMALLNTLALFVCFLPLMARLIGVLGGYNTDRNGTNGNFFARVYYCL